MTKNSGESGSYGPLWVECRSWDGGGRGAGLLHANAGSMSTWVLPDQQCSGMRLARVAPGTLLDSPGLIHALGQRAASRRTRGRRLTPLGAQ
jgi:hypothetical protein